MSEFDQGSVETWDGARLHYEIHGQGPLPLALCDGLGCDGFAWKYLLPELRRRHRVLRWHYRGHGRSSVPWDLQRLGMPYSCDDLARVMDAARINRAVVFGHSMGVQVALEFHRRFPDRVRGLVLVCGSYGHPLDTLHGNDRLKRAMPFLRPVVEKFPRVVASLARVILRSDLATELTLRYELNRKLLKREDLGPYFDHLSQMDPVVFIRTLTSLAEHTAWDHLPHVDVPTLVFGGESDKFTPLWLSHQMAEAIPRAKLVVLPEGSHTAPLEHPERVHEAVRSFLDQHADVCHPAPLGV